MFRTSIRFLLLIVLASPAAASSTGAYVLRVDGLACPYCAYGVEKKLKRVTGVETVEFDLESGEIRLTVKQGTRLTERDLAGIIDEAGFTLRGVRREPPSTAAPAPEAGNQQPR